MNTSFRRPHWLWLFVLAGLILAMLTVVAGLMLTGAADPKKLLDPGPLVRWGLPIVTVILNLSATVAIGAFFLCAFVLPQPQSGDETASASTVGTGSSTQATGFRPGQSVGSAWQRAAGTGLIAVMILAPAQLAHLILTHLSALGTDIGDVPYGAHLLQYITEIDAGRILIWGVLISVVAAAVGAAVASRSFAAVTVLLVSLSLVPLALTGHAAGAANHELAVTAIWLHLLGVTVWAGGLAVLALVAQRLGSTLGDVTERYSKVALWCFVLVALSGIASSWIRIETIGDLFTSSYGQLLLVKIALTTVLGVAGWWHRRATIPAIRAHAATPVSVDHAQARSRTVVGWAFWRLAGVEVLIMGAVIGVAVALGSSAPPVPQEPIPDASMAFFLTGHPVPSAPTALAYLTQWRLDPLLGSLSIVAVLVYLLWVARLRRHGQDWPMHRTVLWVIGWVVFFWATNGGPSVYGGFLFSGYALQLVIITAVVPVLLIQCAPLTLALRALPQRGDGSSGPREWLLQLTGTRAAGAVAHPVLLAVLLGGSLLVLFLTPLLDLTASSFFARGALLVYLLLLSSAFLAALTAPYRHPRSRPVRLLALGIALLGYATTAFTILAQTQLLSTNYFGLMGLPWLDDALVDQDLGGWIILSLGILNLITLAIGTTSNRLKAAREVSSNHSIHS